MTANKYLPGSRPPITDLATGTLYRAFVALPASMTEPDRPLQERVVFFEAPYNVDYAGHLEALLAKIWGVSTLDWCTRGYIYNITSATELMSWAFDAGQDSDLTLFETGSGGNGIEAVGPNRIHYARIGDVDLFVTPRVARRLLEALDAIELLYQGNVRG